MIDTESENMNQSQIAISGLGSRLKSAREAMSLTTKEAAAHLHLSVNIIDIIEKEQFSDGPPPTFMRGYLRSYARFLNVPEAEISKALKELEITMPLKNASMPILNTRPIPKNDRYLHWITYLIVFTMAILVLLWWHSHQRYVITDVPTKTTPELPTGSASTTTPNTTIETSPATANTIDNVPNTSTDAVTTAPTTTTDTKKEVSAPPITPSSSPLITPMPAQSNTTPSATTPSNESTAATSAPSAVPTATQTPVTDTTAPATPMTTVPAPLQNDAPNATTTSPIAPQIDTPPIISTLVPDGLSQASTPVVEEVQPTASQHSHKHSSGNRRHATLPGMPGVNMALPEPN